MCNRVEYWSNAVRIIYIKLYACANVNITMRSRLCALYGTAYACVCGRVPSPRGREDDKLLLYLTGRLARAIKVRSGPGVVGHTHAFNYVAFTSNAITYYYYEYRLYTHARGGVPSRRVRTTCRRFQIIRDVFRVFRARGLYFLTPFLYDM